MTGAGIAAKPAVPPLLYLWARNHLMRKNMKKAGLEDYSTRPYAAKAR
jgi:hypothetical protein